LHLPRRKPGGTGVLQGCQERVHLRRRVPPEADQPDLRRVIGKRRARRRGRRRDAVLRRQRQWERQRQSRAGQEGPEAAEKEKRGRGGLVEAGGGPTVLGPPGRARPHVLVGIGSAKPCFKNVV